jgi:hypothetical protein
MRTLRLAHIALEAEGLRLRHHARRTAARLILLAVACCFVLTAGGFGHAAVWFWLRLRWDAPEAAAFIVGGDVILAMFFALLAARSTPGAIEREALAVRRRAIDSAAGAYAISALTLQAFGLLGRLIRRR